MKCKGIIFTNLILILLLGLMPFTTYAQNGSIVLSYAAPQQNGVSQFSTDKKIYSLDEVITIDSNFDRISEGMRFYLWKQNTGSSVYNFEYNTYLSLINANKVYESDLYFSNGTYTIELNSLKKLTSGNYVVSLVCAEKQQIYDYYIIIVGTDFAIGSPNEYANYILNMKVITDTGTSYNVITDRTIDSDSAFSHNGKALIQGNSIVTLNTTLRSLKENKYANGYIISLQGLSATWDSNSTTPGFHSPLTFCVSIKNKNGNFILGYINNVNDIADTYELYCPSEYINGLDTTIETDDDITLVLNDVSSKSYDYYYLSWSNIDICSAYILGLNPDKNAESLGALDDAGNALGNVEKPEVDLDDLDINNYVDSDSLDDISALLGVFYSNQIFITMIMLVISMAVIAYIFFGKR